MIQLKCLCMKRILLMFFLLYSVFYSQSQSLTDSLKAHFKFEGNLRDSSGFGEDLTTTDPVNYELICANDSAFEFDGNVRLGSVGTFNNSAYTETAISLWFKTSTIKSSRQLILQGAAIGFAILIEASTGNLDVFFDGSSAGSLTSPSSVADGNWHHMVAQNNGTKTFMYIDTVLIDSITESLFNGTGASNNKLFFGKTSFNFDPYTGSLNEVRIYNRILTESEIEELYRITNDAFNDSIEIVTSCDTSYFWPQTGITYVNSGIYKDTVSSTTSCDSIYMLDLTLNKPTDSSLNVVECDSFMWPQTGITYTSSGMFADTILNARGCDSVINLDLTIINSSNLRQVAQLSACREYTWSRTGNTYLSSGTFHDTLVGPGGCDSIFTLQLTIVNIDTLITKNADTLSVNQTGASYQWLDCDNNYAQIVAATDAVFVPSSNGNYACRIISGACIDTTKCVNVIITGIDEQPFWSGIKVYPNPFQDYLMLGLNSNNRGGIIEVEVISLTGKKVGANILRNGDKIKIGMEGKPKGIYLLRLINGRDIHTRKIILN